MPAKFLSSRVMVMIVLMPFLAAGEASHGNFMPTFFRYVIGLAAFSALANSVPVCHAGSAGVLRLTTAVRRSQQARFAVR